ncbi:hypothetical protein HMPREF0004_2874 [Achromobacter piechaudii ATCC 43553]|uniref:Uncharacterized protein n=1 Tax=Achromobacter piechaudii ATCC 43553 TaxID=742159 RepID=D4XBM7_9BURK|nr:hypothetical protein HMPREF0004_2874 [Achromobacter piechaudii ATCC 43553]
MIGGGSVCHDGRNYRACRQARAAAGLAVVIFRDGNARRAPLVG